MSIGKFCRLLHDAKYDKNDKKWFPAWLRRYAAGAKVAQGKLPVTLEDVIRFSRSLRDSGTVQELLGHKDVRTKMIYLHRMNKPELAVKSPADVLAGVGN